MQGHWDPVRDGALDEAGLDALLDQAWAEGVTVLACQRLAEVPTLPPARRQDCRDWLRSQAAAELGRRARLRAVLARLQQEGIEVLVLKGAALGQWLYPAPCLRESSDVDLLLTDREQALRAAAALVPLGYAMPGAPGRFTHELACRSADGALELDLHWALSDWPVLDRLPGWAALVAGSIALPTLGPSARGLGPGHALLHAGVHRASNLGAGLGDRLKWLYDLHLLVRALDADGGWPDFAAACRQARTCGIADEALAASADLFGTVVPAGVMATLAEARAGEPLDAARLQDWRYLQRLNFTALPGWGARLAWLGARLLPPAAHLRGLYGEDRSWLALLWQRVQRMAVRMRGAA